LRISRINPWAGLGGLPRGVYLLCAVILVNRLTSMVLPFLVLYCASELGFSTAASGLALTSYGLGSMPPTCSGSCRPGSARGRSCCPRSRACGPGSWSCSAPCRRGRGSGQGEHRQERK
jgi:hypothetical protein